MKKINELPAHSDTTDTDYACWDNLVEAEANGYVLVGTSTRPSTSPIVIGPFETKKEANEARPRYYQKWKRQEARYGSFKVSTSIRVLWKDIRK